MEATNGPRFVSTGASALPVGRGADRRGASSASASEAGGENSQVYPALARMPAELFGICVARTEWRRLRGRRRGLRVHDHERREAVRLRARVSARRPRRGTRAARRQRHRPPVQLPDRGRAGRRRPDEPDGQPGAIATTSLVPGATAEEKWELIREGLSRFAGPQARARTTRCTRPRRRRTPQPGHRPPARELRPDLLRPGRGDGPVHATELASRDRQDLAVMGATLAHGGVNPLTGERVVDEAACRHALAVMTTAGLYETSGDWLYDVGLPGKSGIGGGIVTVSPGKGGLGTFAPPLDAAGNSVKGQLVAAFLSRRLGLDLFRRAPREQRVPPPRAVVRRARARRDPPAAADLADETRARRALRPGRAARRAGGGVRLRRAVPADRRRPALRRADGRAPRAVERRRPDRDRARRGRSRRTLRVPPRLPGERARPGLRLRALGRRLTEGSEPTVYAHVATDPEPPRAARAPVLVLLRLQRLEQPARGRLGDDPARLRRRRRARGARRRAGRVGYSQHEGAERADWGDEKLELVDGRPRSSTRLPARTRTSSTRRSTSAARPSRASAATTRAGRTSSSAAGRHTIPSDPRPRAALPVDRLRGALGRAPARVLQRADRAEPEDLVDGADRISENWRDRGYAVPTGGARHRARPTSSARGRRRLARAATASANPAPRCWSSPRLLALLVYGISRATWRPRRRSASRAGARGARSSPPPPACTSARAALPRHRGPVHPARLRHLAPSGGRPRRVRPRSGSTRRESAGGLAGVVVADRHDDHALGLGSSRRRRPAPSSRSTRGARSGRFVPTGSRSTKTARCSARSASPSLVWVALNATVVLVPVAIWLAVRWSLLAQVVELEDGRLLGAPAQRGARAAAAGCGSPRSSDRRAVALAAGRSSARS